MRGAATSKTMFPCERGVHLHKSASSKTIFEKIQTSHKDDAKNDHKTIWKPIKNPSRK